MRIDRRAFARGAVGLAASAMSGCRSQSAGPQESQAAAAQPLIDTHQHLWDLKRFSLPWLKKAGERLNRTYTVEHYAQATASLNVVKAVYEEVAVRPDQWDAEADYAVALCRSETTPTAAAIIGGNPAAAGFEQYITRFKGSPYVKGLRHSYARGKYVNEQFIAGVRLLGELGMSFDLNTGGDLLAESAKLVAACPRTRFVLDHCGNPNVKWFTSGREGEAPSEPSSNDQPLRNARRSWEAGVARLAEQPNVVCKISGVAESGEDGKVTAQVVAPAVNYCLDRFGQDRVMFASNWPVCLKTITLAAWVSILKEVVAPRSEQFSRKLFYGNAAGFFGL